MLPSLLHYLAIFSSLISATAALKGRSPSLLVSRGSNGSDYSTVCGQISSAISSSSEVFYPLSLSLDYSKDIGHWMTSSSQNSACSVEPGSAEDLGVILQILANTSTPFAVKGGGHASNPGYSSTPGVQIAMYRFSATEYSEETSTVVVGAGLIWDNVYEALEPYAVNVVGGRVTGVGVAGFTLGGGLSWKSNQYGLTVDNVVAFDLVLPNGTYTHVTADNEDLFFALKGGFNNYGIVTQFTMKVYPQTEVWGGLITYTWNEIDAVIAATAAFQANNTDPKASIITTINYLAGQPGVSQLLFYDYPTPPSGIFDDFLAIPYFTKDVSTRSFVSLVQSSPANATSNQRGVFNSLMFSEYPESLLTAIQNETSFWGSQLQFQGGTFISYEIEAFLPTYMTVSTTPTAWPPARSTSLPFLPVNIYYAWQSSLFDDNFYSTIQKSTSYLEDIGKSEGQNLDDGFVYGNYAIFNTPLSSIYGGNVDRLKAIKQQIDPNNVMGLAGGWKF